MSKKSTKARMLRVQKYQVEEMRAASAARKAAGIGKGGSERVLAELLDRLLADIPADTRTMSQQICGEPLPGRSALDRRSIQEGES